MKKIKLFYEHTNKELERVANEFMSNPEIKVLDVQIQRGDKTIIMIVYTEI